MIEVICPKCGSVLTSHVIATYPPINKVSCPHCGWEREDKQNIIRVVMQEPPIQTNGDLVRQMSDEELARYYAKRIARCYGCEAVTEDDCFECQMDWLKAPVREGAG